MVLADVLSAGIVWGTIGAIGGALLCLAWFVFWLLEGESIAWFGFAGFVVIVILWAVASWPLKYDYHHWVDKQGTVQAIGHRLISNGDNGINDRYVFRIDGKPYGVDDTRASLAKVGDRVHLQCKKEHQLFQKYENDGWACRWINGEGI